MVEQIPNNPIGTLELKRELSELNPDSRFIVGELRIARRKTTDILPVEKTEWDKIKNFLDKARPVSYSFQNKCSVCLGILASSIIFLLSISPTDERLIVKVVAWSMLAISFVLSIIFGWHTKKEKIEIEMSIAHIKSEMESYESKYSFEVEEEV